ncbi:MAG: branched-chain amino acid ABC transporter permease [Halobacteriaceae archaeon]
MSISTAIDVSPKIAVLLIMSLAAGIFPFISTGYYITVMFTLLLYISLVAGWNFVGYNGYINFGQAAFYGWGAYFAAISISYFNIPFGIAIIIGGIGGMLVGIVLGLMSLQLSGHYFSIASLLLLIISTTVFQNLNDVTGIFGYGQIGQEIYLSIPKLIPGLSHTHMFYYIMLIVAFAHIIGSIWLEQTKYGYGMKAIREGEVVARGLGVPTFRLKLFAITISGFGSAVTGAVYASYYGYVDTGIFFSLGLTFLIVFMGIVGSMGEWYGPIIGGLIFVPADTVLTGWGEPELAQIIFGSIFVVIILLQPRGLGRYLERRFHQIDTDWRSVIRKGG